MLEFVFQILAYFSGIFSFMLYSGNKTIYKLANSHIRERGLVFKGGLSHSILKAIKQVLN